jgi:hypothetical protein
MRSTNFDQTECFLSINSPSAVGLPPSSRIHVALLLGSILLVVFLIGTAPRLYNYLTWSGCLVGLLRAYPSFLTALAHRWYGSLCRLEILHVVPLYGVLAIFCLTGCFAFAPCPLPVDVPCFETNLVGSTCYWTVKFRVCFALWSLLGSFARLMRWALDRFQDRVSGVCHFRWQYQVSKSELPPPFASCWWARFDWA